MSFKKTASSLGILLLLFSGCEKQAAQQPQAHLYQRQRPIVALLPVIDHSQSELSWNLSEEFTGLIHHRLMQKETIYLVDKERVRSLAKNIKQGTPFDLDMSWLKKTFFDQEFVVFMELTAHEELSYRSPEGTSLKDGPSEILMKMRLRVFDLRGENPKIALQEILTNSHTLPKQFTQFHSDQIPWGSDHFSLSPLGMAHMQMAKEIAADLEEYILLSLKEPPAHG
jgi:hypothetical protein